MNETTQTAVPAMDADYLRMVNEVQSELYAFIVSMLGGSRDVHDVLQETNVVLWEKSKQFDRNREFRPWAYRIAHLQVLAYKRRVQREKVVFSSNIVDQLAERVPGQVADVDRRLVLLEECLNKLSDKNRDLLKRRYRQTESLQKLSNALGRSSSALGVVFYRLRKTLADCIENKLQEV